MEEKKKCEPCPEGMVHRAGKCVMPEVTFEAFVVSLSTSVLLHLGEIKDPATGRKNKNLLLAKHAIDTLNMIQEKTKGNLTEDEMGLLGNILFDLRMRYVKAKEEV